MYFSAIHTIYATCRSTMILCFVIFDILFLKNVICTTDLHDTEPNTYDGWFNNLVHPDWGAIDGQLIRRSPPAYSDGVFEPAGRGRPNPLDISTAAHSGQAGLGSARGRNAMLVYYGQQLVEEVLDVQRPGCPFEYENIPVPKGHPRFDVNDLGNVAIPFLRSRYDSRTGYSPNNPRQQINEISAYLDGTLFYGPGKAWTDAIREFRGGRLLVDNSSKPLQEQFPAPNDFRLPFANPPPPRDHYLKSNTRFFRIGNIRGFENPFQLTFAVIWFRWHNHVAAELANQNPNWDDELLFNNARKRVIAHHQKISMYDWLPRFLSIDESGNLFNIPPYYRNDSDSESIYLFNGYDAEVHPGIAQEFQTAAMRFGHTLVPPGVWLRGASSGGTCDWRMLTSSVGDRTRTVNALRLCNTYFNGQETVEPMMDDLIRGMSSTLSEREDPILVADLREHVFGSLDFSRRDLAALNIQRAREHGVSDYNTVREAYKLPKLTDWNEINSDTDFQNGAIANLKALYDNRNESIDDIDLFTGGLLETTLNGPGPLFQRILLDQFMRLRHGDRFWFENTDSRFRQFNNSEIEYIRQVTLKDIITNVTNIDPNDLPDDIFIHNNASDPCPQPLQIAADTYQLNNGTLVTENCTALRHYDYFTGSAGPYITTFTSIALCIPGTYLMMVCMAKMRRRSMSKARRKMNKISKSTVTPRSIKVKSVDEEFEAKEWMGYREGMRRIMLILERSKNQILVKDLLGQTLRIIDLVEENVVKILLSATGKKRKLMSIRVDGYIDLVLRFDSNDERLNFEDAFMIFLKQLSIKYTTLENETDKSIFKAAKTKVIRDKELADFFRIFTAKVFDGGLKPFVPEEQLTMQKMSLTRYEFADVLGLKADSAFIDHMFKLVDKDGNGFIGFQEFMDFFFLMSEGDANKKASLIFNMYDNGNKGHLTKKDFSSMIMSLMDLSDNSNSLTEKERSEMIDTIYGSAGLKGKKGMDLKTFKDIFLHKDYFPVLDQATLPLEGIKSDKEEQTINIDREGTFLAPRADIPRSTPASRQRTPSAAVIYTKSRSRIQQRSRGSPTETPPPRPKSNVSIRTEDKPIYPSKFWQRLYSVRSFFETRRLDIFWLILYTLVTAGIFIERVQYYTNEREHGGLRRIAGLGVSITRGAASVMMFTYTSLMITMCRNIITHLRESFCHRFIPFDSAHLFHKYIASIAILFTVVHCVGHGFNFYHICTQPPADVSCYFREYKRFTDVLPTFSYWAFGTITGMTGIILVYIVIYMVIFALPYARRHLHNMFNFTHKFYILLYIFMFLHGAGRLVQPPYFHYFFLGPALVFIFDKSLTLRRRKRELKVLKTEILPSDVLSLTFKKPLDFNYISGQWVRIACPALSRSEYHPFTLTSAPHEDTISLHIRAVGPWTMNLRSIFDKANTANSKVVEPKLFLDGPFGEGHQDWYKYPVSVLVGGGIGVTPFASILKDIVHKVSNSKGSFNCKKIYFLWVTRTQKQFEWFTDIIREVEKKDKHNLVDIHIFVTQFKHQYDLRTTMLYICERHFQKLAGKSLLTGLRSITHFGRPRFYDFFNSLSREYPKESKIGVFSCGPLPMSLAVEKACSDVAKLQQRSSFIHHHENF